MRTPAFGLAFLGLLTWTVTTSAEENPQPQEQLTALAAKTTVARQAQRGDSLYLSDIVRSFTRMYYNLSEVAALTSTPAMPIAAGSKTAEDLSVGVLGKAIDSDADHAHQVTSAAGRQ